MKTFRVGMDARILTLAVGGVGRYALSLAEALVRHGPPEMELTLFTGPGVALSGALAQARHWDGGRRVKSSLLRAAWYLPAGAAATKVDLFHAANYGSAPLWRPGGFPLVATLHDLAPLLGPEHFTLKHRLVARVQLAQVARTASRFIAVSEVSRREAILRLGLDPARVRVIPEAPAESMRRVDDPARVAGARRRHGLEAPYLLAVGTLEPRKNIARLLAAFRALVTERRDQGHKLALVGRAGWLMDGLPRLLADPALAGRVVATGFVPDEDLAALYTGATAAVYPSLYEGFGLPVLEAMACGTPVVASRAGAIPEVAGGAALLIDPLREDELAEALGRIIDDAALRSDLAARGLERSREFSWRETALRTVEVYREALAEADARR